MATIEEDGALHVTASLSREQEPARKNLAAGNKVSGFWLVGHAVDQLVEQGYDAQLPLNFGRS